MGSSKSSFKFQNPQTKSFVQTLLDNKDYSSLSSLMLPRIEFGTAGLRSEMKAGFAFMNDLVVLQTTQGVAEYLLSQQPQKEERTICIGFDHRNNSYKFALITALVFIEKGFKVVLFGETVATPIVAFAVNFLKCEAGVMITASHNPKRDNGYKLYGGNGCQIKSPVDKAISSLISMNLKPSVRIGDDLESIVMKSVSNPYKLVLDAYMKRTIEFLKPWNAPIGNPIKIAYTPVHGVGLKFIQRLTDELNISSNFEIVDAQAKEDAEFPTVTYPNPEEGKQVYELAIREAESKGCTVIFANDPDADRFSMAEKQDNGEWRIFNGNEIAAIIISFLLDKRGKFRS